ncbi:MAG: hypothetical protein RIQ72_478 [Candidatus Parcubacteria bacterium]|jgi:hypothetical protein
MLHTHFFNRYGIVCHKSPESYGGFVENIGDEADISEGNAECENTKDNANASMTEFDLLPSEVDSMSENQPGSSEHGTLVSGEVEDPEVLRTRLREMLG